MKREHLEAYRRTSYSVDLPDGRRMVIRIDRRCPEIDALLTNHGVTTWAYLTAHNPGSTAAPATDNAERQRQLVAAVTATGYAALPGEGTADDGRWPPEPSFLVLGITRDAASSLASDFGQLAYVYGVLGGAAELVGLQ